MRLEEEVRQWEHAVVEPFKRRLKQPTKSPKFRHDFRTVDKLVSVVRTHIGDDGQYLEFLKFLGRCRDKKLGREEMEEKVDDFMRLGKGNPGLFGSARDNYACDVMNDVDVLCGEYAEWGSEIHRDAARRREQGQLAIACCEPLQHTQSKRNVVDDRAYSPPVNPMRKRRKTEGGFLVGVQVD